MTTDTTPSIEIEPLDKHDAASYDVTSFKIVMLKVTNEYRIGQGVDGRWTVSQMSVWTVTEGDAMWQVGHEPGTPINTFNIVHVADDRLSAQRFAQKIFGH